MESSRAYLIYSKNSYFQLIWDLARKHSTKTYPLQSMKETLRRAIEMLYAGEYCRRINTMIR